MDTLVGWRGYSDREVFQRDDDSSFRALSGSGGALALTQRLFSYCFPCDFLTTLSQDNRDEIIIGECAMLLPREVYPAFIHADHYHYNGLVGYLLIWIDRGGEHDGGNKRFGEVVQSMVQIDDIPGKYPKIASNETTIY